MATPRPAGGEREEPPFLFGLVGEGIKRSASLLNATLRSIDQRVLVRIWGGGTLAVLLLIVSAGIVASPTVTGVLQAVFAGIFLALLFAVGFGSLVISTRPSPAPGVALATAHMTAALNARLEPAIAELNALRRDLIADVKSRSITRIPAGIAAGVALWGLCQSNASPPGAFSLFMFVVVGALGGEMWAVHGPDRRYRRIYKERVLSQLAAEAGDLTYREASRERVATFAAERILPDHDRLEAEDSIVGSHGGLPVEIIEVRLRKRVNKKTRLVFDGLLVGVTLPRKLTGTTVVMTDRGLWEKFKTGWRGGTFEPVRLEHLAFEQRYEVYSTDQVEARALLTPAFMERFMALADASGFALPGAMAEGNTLVVALPNRTGATDLFEPPPYWKPAGGDALVRLQTDIRKVLDMTDTVIHLDFWARGRQGDVAGAGMRVSAGKPL